MWRNVFGHAFLQIVVLVVFLFKGQDWLCSNYSVKCMAFDSTGACLSYNPFFISSGKPYYTAKDIDFWTDLNLNLTDFDATLLNSFKS